MVAISDSVCLCVCMCEYLTPRISPSPASQKETGFVVHGENDREAFKCGAFVPACHLVTELQEAA